MNGKNRGNERKTYAKPELHRVVLRPEESLAAGCKTLSTTASNQVTTPCSIASCLADGS